MNEAERGIAAYRAASGKGKGSGAKPRPKDALQATVELSGKHAAHGARRTAPADRSRAPSAAKGVRSDPAPAGTAKTEGLLKARAGERGYRKVARFLLLLGQEEAAKILKHFTREEIEGITAEIARVRRIDDGEAKQLLKEFGAAKRQAHSVKAGPETAKAMLRAAFGEERAASLIRRALPRSGQSPFGFLADIDYEQILLLLKSESARAVSIVLASLDPKKAAKIVEHLPPDIQSQVVKRIAKMEKVDPEVINRIEEVLKERIRTQGTVVSRDLDGKAALAEILKHMDIASEEKILGDLAEFDPELSRNVKDRVYTVEILLKVDDQDLQSILREYDDREIAVLLKGKDEAIGAKLLANLSARRRTIVAEELEHLGKMRKSDVDKATKEFVDYLLELDGQRKISIHWDDNFVD